jgi:hypothetical protein
MMRRLLICGRIGTRGNSKYHYYGIRVKASSVLNHMDLSSQPPRPPVAKKRVHKSGDPPPDQSIQVRKLYKVHTNPLEEPGPHWTGTYLNPLSKPVAGEIPKDREIGIVVCRQYAVSDTIAMRGVEAVHAHSCEHAA